MRSPAPRRAHRLAAPDGCSLSTDALSALHGAANGAPPPARRHPPPRRWGTPSASTGHGRDSSRLSSKTLTSLTRPLGDVVSMHGAEDEAATATATATATAMATATATAAAAGAGAGLVSTPSSTSPSTSPTVRAEPVEAVPRLAYEPARRAAPPAIRPPALNHGRSARPSRQRVPACGRRRPIRGAVQCRKHVGGERTPVLCNKPVSATRCRRTHAGALCRLAPCPLALHGPRC